MKTDNADPKMLEGQPFVTEDVRDIVIIALLEMQKQADLSPTSAKATGDELAWLNRRFIEQQYSGFIAKAAAPCVVMLDARSGQV